MKSVMDHTFSVAPSIDAPRSSFNRSFGYKTAFDAGYLVPFFTDDVMPGDTFNLQATLFARLATPIFPVMDNMYLDTHFFFVPYRLLWDNARKFFGEQLNPADSIDYSIPETTATATEESLSDYFGIPIGVSLTHTSLYHRAYAMVWNEWFRDQNLQDSVACATGDGPDTLGTDVGNTLLRRGKRHDYFTSALPWPQKGDAVSLPLGTQAPVAVDQNKEFTATSIFGIQYNNGVAGIDTAATGARASSIASDTGWDLFADLTTATAATINDLREAFQVQKLLERDARGGTRYSELVKNHFGVNFYDISYRPEFLGGGSTPININPVATTTDGTRDVGDLGAFGTALAKGHGFTKSFVEHGVLIGLVSVRADLTYQQGLERRFSHSTRYDKYWPSLAHLGEQAILNKEIYAQGTSADDDVFGYQERYAEYRYKPSLITGAMRSTALTPLDSWHLSQEFTSLPTLGDTFIQETPPVSRVVAVTTEPELIMDSYINLICARPMPVYGVPGLIDHF